MFSTAISVNTCVPTRRTRACTPHTAYGSRRHRAHLSIGWDSHAAATQRVTGCIDRANQTTLLNLAGIIGGYTQQNTAKQGPPGWM